MESGTSLSGHFAGQHSSIASRPPPQDQGCSQQKEHHWRCPNQNSHKRTNSWKIQCGQDGLPRSRRHIHCSTTLRSPGLPVREYCVRIASPHHLLVTCKIHLNSILLGGLTSRCTVQCAGLTGCRHVFFEWNDPPLQDHGRTFGLILLKVCVGDKGQRTYFWQCRELYSLDLTWRFRQALSHDDLSLFVQSCYSRLTAN
jgi:hypothetical protein